MDMDESAHKDGPGAVAWLVIIILGIIVACFCSGGCASSKPTEHYPFPIMLDPVTEVTPNVHVK